MNKILVLANSDIVIFNFRKELMLQLIEMGYEIVIVAPEGAHTDELINYGMKYRDIKIKRRGKNPLNDLMLFFSFIQIIHDETPFLVLTYTIKPNIYGGIACRILNIKYITNITGLGSGIKNSLFLKELTSFMYKIALKKAEYVFFQNKQNLDYFLTRGIAQEKYLLTSGSGVNLEEFNLLPYPQQDTLEFVFISRIMKEKGIEEYLYAAQYIRERYPFTRFHICGWCEENYVEVLKEYEEKEIIIYHGLISNVKDILKIVHCTILPSYHEGMSNALLESAACGRPLLASNIPGCCEIIEDGISGYLFEMQNKKALINAIERFISLPFRVKEQMGLSAREKVKKDFDREKVTSTYINQIEKIRTSIAR